MKLLTQHWVNSLPVCPQLLLNWCVAAFCGVKYTHTNDSVIRSTRLEQKISAQAVEDVMDHHQNSQVAANVVSQLNVVEIE